MWHVGSIVTNGNAILSMHNTLQDHATYNHQNPSANADSFTNGCQLRAGTYTFRVLGITNNNCPIIDWTLDGVEIVANQDWYSAALTWNVTKSVAAIAVTFDGWHVLRGTVDGKNVSSSDYYMFLTNMVFEPAAD